MKKSNINIIVLISLSVFVSLIIIGIVNFFSYRDIIKDNITNTTKQIALNVESEINSELIKPIYVSLTMANDQFLKDWIQKDKEENMTRVMDYLSGIKKRYDYKSAFFISTNTNTYYNNSGIVKQMNENDIGDTWYYKLLQSGKEYILDIEDNQALDNNFTFTVKCKIYDENQKVLGITGVGVELAEISKILQKYKDEADAEVYLIDFFGDIKIHAENEKIKYSSIFVDEEINNLKNYILSTKTGMNLFEIDNGLRQAYIMTYYIEDLDWYLIVKKESTLLYDTLKNQIINEIIIFFGLLVAMIFINSIVINYFNSKITKAATTDKLTNLNNRRMFDQYLKTSIMHCGKNEKVLSLAILDVDNFKTINDRFGHDIGDNVLKAVANETRNLIRKDDVVARWGGDEFVIIFNCGLDIAIKAINRLKVAEGNNEILKKYNVTTSIGITEYKANDTEETIFKRADEALIKAKNNGKNQICNM